MWTLSAPDDKHLLGRAYSAPLTDEGHLDRKQERAGAEASSDG